MWFSAHFSRNTILLLGAVIPFFTLNAPLRAELVFAKPTVNLGKIKGGTSLVQDFAFAVQGKEPVEILELRPGCGCVTPQLDKKKYQPGDRGTISLKINTLGEAEGAHRWYVYLFYRQGSQQQHVALQLLATVLTEVTIQPARLSIHTAGPWQQDIVLTDFRSQPLPITALRASADFLQVAAGKPVRDRKGHWTIKIQVKIDDPLPEGRTESLIDIYSDDPAYRQLQVPVVLTRPAGQRLSATPAEIKLNLTQGQPIPSRLVLIRDAKDEPVLINKIKPDHPALQCRWAKGPGHMATLKIQVDATQFEGNHLQSAVHLEFSGDGRKEIITIPVHYVFE